MSTPQPSPSIQVMQMLYGALLANLISAVAEFGVADLLEDGPRPVEELAALTETDPDALYRALRALAAASVFAEVAPRRFALTPLAATLRTGAAGSMRDHARNWGSAEYQRSFTEIRHSVRTGLPGFDHAYGTDWWSYLRAHPESADTFNRAMGNRATQIAAAAVEAVDLSDVRRLVDVGGGHGQLVSALLGRYPDLKAVVFDMPEVVEHARRALSEAGNADRAETVGGSFFETVPAAADAYVLSSILHDWNDVDATKILDTVRRAMHPAGKVLVVDMVLPAGDAAHPGKLLDVVMLTLVGGRERTEAEFAGLFAGAGLRHTETVATTAPVSVLVAAPA
jgi:predicted O-methyltransferase YrrM